MKNKIDEALEYAINRFEKVIESEKWFDIRDGVCVELWDAKFSDSVVNYIANLGLPYARKMDILQAESRVYWFDETGTERSVKARLDVLKLIRDERISRSKELKGQA